ncbi:hypothetical protein J3R30DRAFT_3523219 [Lentinula aciculospora]|uniref:Uncharacterized protein n=1 Tax=Lentinula aciculospora TaxID=153920 RepID=A0A9W9DJB9_9AGAR|nr:hypothetical protein J3R30DRAFT_3523219 [Lentinula aciculospora]
METRCQSQDTTILYLIDLVVSESCPIFTSFISDSSRYFDGLKTDASYCASIFYPSSVFVGLLTTSSLANFQHEPRPTNRLHTSPRGYYSTILADSRLWILWLRVSVWKFDSQVGF